MEMGKGLMDLGQKLLDASGASKEEKSEPIKTSSGDALLGRLQVPAATLASGSQGLRKRFCGAL